MGLSGTSELQRLAALAPEAVLAELGSSAQGLSTAAAGARLEADGPNVVAPRREPPAVIGFLASLASPLPLVLLCLAVVSWITGEHWGAGVITAIVLLSTLLALGQQRRSERAAARLRALVQTSVTVLRPDCTDAEGLPRCAVPAAQLVRGDVIALAAGAAIPADVRILGARDLFVGQAALTGEALPVEKWPRVNGPLPETVADLPTLAFMGSTVVSGSATAVVIGTGARTSFGALAAAAAEAREVTAFDRGIARYVGMMLKVMAVMLVLVLLINGFGKHDWLGALLFAVAVAVGLTPEMLPMLVTVNLARGALVMARKDTIVKRLNAIQNLGAMDVLCTDKTGTLTQDRVILEKHVDIEGKDSPQVLEYAYLNSYFQAGMQNLLDVAVLQHVQAHEHFATAQRYRKVDELPFDFERRRMSVIVEDEHGARLMVCKGAVEEVLNACSHAARDGTPAPLADAHGAALAEVVEDLNEEGFRVIAVATRSLPSGPASYTTADECELVLAGYIAFLDPPKDSAADAIRALRHAGVEIKVLTGDSAIVTRSVCRHVGLDVRGTVTGAELARMDPPALEASAADATVFAKLTPQQKSELIQALQRRGHVVGFLGDGINDSVALRTADVGISVDSAADIAKDAADIILLKKSLSVLKDGVLEGRRVFANIVTYLRMSASSSFGNVLSVLGATLVLPFVPMAPVQILLNNLLYDLSQAALPTDRVDHAVLRRPHAWDLGEIRRAMLVLGPVSSLFDYATFAVLWFAAGGAADPRAFQTGWFVESLLSQTLVIHVLRTGRLPFVESRASPAVLWTSAGICAIGLWLPFSPLGPLLGMRAPAAPYWIALPLLLSAYLLLAHLANRRLIRGAEPRSDRAAPPAAPA
ncbi:MAG TPA: magnesium-translocating P-type ATPase [Telluria sp.]|nr:magnesium-translocating P-type ATPase [Telluria sp.]